LDLRRTRTCPGRSRSIQEYCFGKLGPMGPTRSRWAEGRGLRDSAANTPQEKALAKSRSPARTVGGRIDRVPPTPPFVSAPWVVAFFRTPESYAPRSILATVPTHRWL